MAARLGIGAAAASAALPVPNYVLNGANHIFGPKSIGKHNMQSVLDSFGGNSIEAYYALMRAAQGLADQGTISGIFAQVIQIRGYSVTITGKVIIGIARLNTAYIPPIRK